MKTAIVIPARYHSSRFPGKPLALINGISLIRRVWVQCCGAISKSDVYIATDDDRIKDHCQEFGANVIVVDSPCLTGTDRVFEASKQIEADIIVNVQGDEPLISPVDILLIIERHKQNPNKVHCGMAEITSEDEFRNVNVPKLVVDVNNNLLYISRASIPTNKQLGFAFGMKQVCIYAFSPSQLETFSKLGGKSHNEIIEDIEILRFVDNGIGVRMVEVLGLSAAVDVPEDILRVESMLNA